MDWSKENFNFDADKEIVYNYAKNIGAEIRSHTRRNKYERCKYLFSKPFSKKCESEFDTIPIYNNEQLRN